MTVYRVQDAHGRGPFRPGFSSQWTDDYFADRVKAHPSWVEEFGPDLIRRKGRPGEYYGSAVRTIDKLKEWFSAQELPRLYLLGFTIVSMDVDRILAESDCQVVFARRLPLRESVIIIPLSALEANNDYIQTSR